jgi:NADPH-dependent 2,4-dienoyl-CoA reductase/sulfur reductase-like enzyme/peroxiredoxin family protein/rhodanese-related sulfurtransferase/TusA-related sulfurtransferase
VRLRNLETGAETDERYDRLLLSPGAEVVRPRRISGADSKRVFTLHNIPDLDRIMAELAENRPRRAVVIGGGYIGLEVAENFHERGLFTTVVEGAAQILAPIDEEMAAIVHAHLRDKAIELYLDDKIEHFEDRPDHVVVFLASGKRIQADIVVMSIGVRPEVKLAREAGLELGATGGIKVDEYLATSDPDIFAVGDAIEVTHFVSGKSALIPLAGPANRQARIVADNMLASDPAARKRYGGTMGTAILKAFDLAAACTGLNETQAKALGIPHRAIVIHAGSHASYYPGSRQLSLKLVFGVDGRILGAQAIGADGVDKRIDVIATAIKAGLSVQDLTDLELAYAPPFGSAKDPVNVAGYVASNVLSGFHEIIDWRELRDILKSAPASIQLVDVRTPEEFSIQTLPGARNLELDHLRDRHGELDPNRPVVIFCQVGLRGYLAYRILKQAGFKDVRNLSGGFKTYAWATEKQANPDLFDYESIKRRAPAEIEAERGGCNVAVAGDVHKLDAIGLQCPGPIMKAFKAMAAMEVGDTLEIVASDPAFGRDIRAWSARTGHELLSVGSTKGVITARVRKAPTPVAAEASGAASARDGVSLVVFSGDLDKAMASLIIANGALAMGSKVTLFFTFWGLNLLRKPDAPSPKKSLIDAAFGFMLPKGVGRANRLTNMNFLGAGGRLMRKVMSDKHVDDPADLLASLVSGGATLVACQMSMGVMGLRREELIDAVEIGGVATFLEAARQSGTTLFI